MMKGYKKTLILAGLVVIGIINVCVYWNWHLYYRARDKVEDSEGKIKVLSKACGFYPANDLVYYELGKAYFDLGLKNLQNPEVRDEYLKKSIKSFKRSLRINPASIYGHFNFAQSLLYMSYLEPSFEVNYYDEFKKSALLTGHHSQIFYEVGKIFLSRWPELSEEDREFTIELLRKIATKKKSDELQTILQTWDMNVKDYKVMEKILPEDADVYRMYGKFLGEKSLSTAVRHEVLAQADFLDFQRAKDEFNLGLSEYQYYRLGKAHEHFSRCLRILKRIRFYQNLTAKSLIDRGEFEQKLKAAYLNLAKTLIDQGKGLEDVEEYLRSYLRMENEVASIQELESYLRERGIIKDRLEESFNDLGALAFQANIYFKENRYRDIMRAGGSLQQSFVIVPDAQKDDYVDVLRIVGDAFQKVDYIYDAREFYLKALEIEPDNLETLLKYRENSVRFNDVKRIREVDRRLERVLSPEVLELGNTVIEKGRTLSRRLVFDGRRIDLELHFSGEEHVIKPLVAVYFNGRVVWEDYVGGGEMGEGEGDESGASREASGVMSETSSPISTTRSVSASPGTFETMITLSLTPE
ncbi:MAG: hypothetical protein ACE5LC_11020, partial [Candidatus Aminicenantales bacterium]